MLCVLVISPELQESAWSRVRNYESLGLLPQAERRKSGYRLYTQRHLAALKTGHFLVGGYGGPRMPKIMQALHRDDLSAALAMIDSRHAEQALKRRGFVPALLNRCGWERRRA